MPATRKVRATDGIELAVTESGPPGAPTIVCVHGYPDNSSVWDALAAELASRCRVVTYDVRGSGESDKPQRPDAYRLDQLADDLRSVVDAVSPDRAAHLLGHDWGSVQCWHAIGDERIAARIASYTSISGPSLDHSAAWMRSALRRDGAKPQQVVRQLIDLSYVVLFNLPVVPEWLWRKGFLDRALAAKAKVPSAGTGTGAAPSRPLPDQINGLNLYRANMLGRLARPRPRRTAVPVLVLAPTRDPFVSPVLQAEAPAPWVSDLRVATIAGGHWIIVTDPEVVTTHVYELIDYTEAGNGERPKPAAPSAETPAT